MALNKITKERAIAKAEVVGSRAKALTRLRATIRESVLATTGIDARVEAYRDGEVTFDDLVQAPEWRRYVQSQMRKRPRGTWVDEEDLLQEVYLTTFEAFGTGPRGFDPSRSSHLPKFVVHQALYWLRETMRSTAKIPHRKGQGNVSRGELLIVDEVNTSSRNVGAGESARQRTLLDRIVEVPADQESIVATKIAVERLAPTVRDAVRELLASGSVEAAIEKVSSFEGRRSKKKALDAAVATVFEVSE